MSEFFKCTYIYLYIPVQGSIKVPHWAITTVSARQSGTAGSYHPVITK